jgi:vancomycin aglycone glucosyltransferase
MRVALSTCGDVEPMPGPAGQLRTRGAEVQVCAPPDFAERPGNVAMPLAPTGAPR